MMQRIGGAISMWEPSPNQSIGMWLEGVHLDGPDEVTVVVHFVGTMAAAAGCDTSIQRFSSGVSLGAVLKSMGDGHVGLARVLDVPESFVAMIQGREAVLTEPIIQDTSATLMPSAVCLKGISGAHSGRPCAIFLDPWFQSCLH